MFRVGQDIDPSIFNNLLQILQTKPLEINKYRKNSGLGRSQCFGIVKQRTSNFHGSRQNFARMDIFKELLQIAPMILPIDFSFDAIQVNDNYQTAEHRDVGNRDESAIIGFGEYIGGDLIVEETPVSIKHRVVFFNGSLYRHSTAPYQGSRYSLVFFKVNKVFTQKPNYSFEDKYLVEEMNEVTRWFNKKGENVWSSDGTLRTRRMRSPTLSACIEE